MIKLKKKSLIFDNKLLRTKIGFPYNKNGY